MAKQTVVLKPGQEHKIGGIDVTVIKCGMHKEGSAPARPTVTLEYDDGEPDPQPADPENSQPIE